MPLIENTIEGRINKVDIAIARIRNFDPLATGLMDTPYYVAYSGGKDSDALRLLFGLAGVRHELWHNHTTVDAPETVRYIRSIPNVNVSMPEMTMWKLIEHKKIPPTRLIRYCCEVLKERGGEGRFVATGVRWAESVMRKSKRGMAEILASSTKRKLILKEDNDESRRLFENCQAKGKRILNPIVDWTDAEVWEFLRYMGCESNPLYQEGNKRIGCIGCPMARGVTQERDFVRWPKYRAMYVRAFDKMLIARRASGLPTGGLMGETGEDVMRWWLGTTTKKTEGQMSLPFDLEVDDEE